MNKLGPYNLNTIVVGDCKNHLHDLPDGSVHCVVTSPPYWALRDYGLPPLIWDAKDGCEHRWGETLKSSAWWGGQPNLSAKQASNTGSIGTAKDMVRGSFCSLCMAWRGSLGLEPTPELYVEHLVQIFREVRRVLRPDGVLFLNLGDSYYGAGYSNHKGTGGATREQGGKQKHTYVGVRREVVYDTLGKALEDSQARGCLCGSLCGVCRVAYQSRKSHSDNMLVAMLTASLSASNREHMESQNVHLPTSDSVHQDFRNATAIQDQEVSPGRVDEQLHASLVSMLGESSPQLLDVCLQRANHGVCLLCARSLADYVPVFVGTKPVCTCGKAQKISFSDPHSRSINHSVYPYQGYTTEYHTSQVLKPKDLVGIPWRVAFALQADGWWLRSDIIWAKTNPMPESVRDRPTKAHEYLFLLAKSQRYYYDQEAIRESSQMAEDQQWRTKYPRYRKQNKRDQDNGKPDYLTGGYGWPPSRNKRTVWEMATQPFPGAHFAVFPEKLIEPCIKAGTSEKGCCPACGAPWVRIMRRAGTGPQRKSRKHEQTRMNRLAGSEYQKWRDDHPDATICWHPSCSCDASEPIPCIVFDPFMGAGTTAVVAERLGRNWIGIEMNPDYAALAEERIAAARAKGGQLRLPCN